MMIPPTRLVIASISTGLETYDKPFLLNNDAFPVLQNALCFRKRLIKKPGADLLGRLQRIIDTTDMGGDATITISPTSANSPTALDVGISQFSVGSNVFTDQGQVGPMITLGTNGPGTATLDRLTGVLTITGSIPNTNVIFFPGLPVMGIEMFESDKLPTTFIDFPINVFFDTTYAYQSSAMATTVTFFDVSFFKGTGNPVFWTGKNFQQFFSCNYSRAMFVTNNNPGFHFLALKNEQAGSSIVDVNPTTVTITVVTGFALVVGDILWFNEVTGTIAIGSGVTANQNINGQTGRITVITVNVPVGFDTITVVFDGTMSTTLANFPGGSTGTGGIIQLMTSQVGGTGDGIRWYDGFDNGHTLGFVNFAPPLDNLQSTSTTYLMGARMILPFGNRLLAFGTFEGTSAQGAANAVYYGNRIRYCEINATPFYSFPVPSTFTGGIEPRAWASNIQGFGGFIDLDTTQRIISAAITQGSLILGLESEQRRLNLTGIEDNPFTLTVINPEFGSDATFGIIPMDNGILGVGEYGLLQTSSYDSKRFDEKIIDQIFEIDANNNGFDRICAARDFIHEVLYFTYPSSDEGLNTTQLFPDTTIVYNYREGSFALWLETYTTYGLYKTQAGQTWGDYIIPWEDWDVKWEDLGGSVFLEPLVAAGTPQGFVMTKWRDNSFNQPSLFIQAVSSITPPNNITVTSPNHNLVQGQFVGFWNGFPGASDIKPEFIGFINSVTLTTLDLAFGPDANLSLIIPGVWFMSVIDQPNVFTKQFPAAWSDSKKTRIGAQKYFTDTTTNGQFTVNMYGSQSTINLDDPALFPNVISSNIVLTTPNQDYGLNSGERFQTQTWHRLPLGCIGDTVQLQFLFSNDQMMNVGIATSNWVLHAIILDLYPSRMLA